MDYGCSYTYLCDASLISAQCRYFMAKSKVDRSFFRKGQPASIFRFGLLNDLITINSSSKYFVERWGSGKGLYLRFSLLGPNDTKGARHR